MRLPMQAGSPTLWKGAVYCAQCITILLAGCAAEPKTAVHTPQIRCQVQQIDRPAWALDSIDPEADIYTKGKAALAEIEQRIRYEERLEAAIRACR
ncbi:MULTISPECIES: hypothetical protein [Cupriavidus]|uniref:Lipoprotein n=2 Tax=Cupriavidus TaxID=106589 RepID=A0A375FUS4_9BURK|nr:MULTISPECIES: hypothetical protein [Cupriavidus]QRQ85580.1 hypothetical protein JTE91_05860 [Cupriavidus oxalaticus]QRQ90332.1 hypothetical protein JTE92_06485 [Cupriavidus oxalaticus]WQD84844.1 hypothetical protein U0036_24605 [Cupriavidus oxalaticus]CAG9179641.1 hypothetical protein LMG23992_04028 [Cupriavidus laharis]SPC07754.1 conserved hypothetical protein [Cupriavidus oxalaticus]